MSFLAALAVPPGDASAALGNTAALPSEADSSPLGKKIEAAQVVEQKRFRAFFTWFQEHPENKTRRQTYTFVSASVPPDVFQSFKQKVIAVSFSLIASKKSAVGFISMEKEFADAVIADMAGASDVQPEEVAKHESSIRRLAQTLSDAAREWIERVE